jgi:membrane associated rhomboid family serine protease
VFRKDSRLLTVALLVVFIYGSMFWGIFPYDWKISYESHMAGALVGTLLSIFSKIKKLLLLK